MDTYQVVSEHSIPGPQKKIRDVALEFLKEETFNSVPEWKESLREVKNLWERREKGERVKGKGRRSRHDHAPCRKKVKRGIVSQKLHEIYLDQKLQMLKQFYMNTNSRKSVYVEQGKNMIAKETEESEEEDLDLKLSRLHKFYANVKTRTSDERDPESEVAKSKTGEVEKEDKENAIKDYVLSLRLAIAPKQNGNKQMKKNLKNLNLQISDVVESSKQVDESEQQMIKKGASQLRDDNTVITVADDLHALLPEPPEPPDDGLFTAKVWPSCKLGEAFLSMVIEEIYSEDVEKRVGNIWERLEEDFPFDKKLLPPVEFFSSLSLPESLLPPICGATIDELRPSCDLAFLSHEIEAQLQVSNSDHLYIKRGLFKVISRRERKLIGAKWSLNKLDHTYNYMGQAHTPIINSGQNIHISHQYPNQFQIELQVGEKFALHNIPNIIAIFPENYHATFSSLQKFVKKNGGPFINNLMVDFGVMHLDCSSKMEEGETSMAIERKLVSVIIENGSKIEGMSEAVGVQLRGVCWNPSVLNQSNSMQKSDTCALKYHGHQTHQHNALADVLMTSIPPILLLDSIHDMGEVVEPQEGIHISYYVQRESSIISLAETQHIHREPRENYYSTIICLALSLGFVLWDPGGNFLLLFEDHCPIQEMKIVRIRHVAHEDVEFLNNGNWILLFYNFIFHQVIMLALFVILNCEWGAHKSDDFENITQVRLQTRQEIWVEHSIQELGSSRSPMRETHYKQWDPGEPYLVSCIIGTSCFKIWDPGGRVLLVVLYLHLEDKVNV